MAKEILQITISERKAPNSRFGKWFYWKIWFQFWGIWKPKMLSRFYKTMSNLMLLPLSKEKRAELLKEFEEIEVQIVNDTMNDDMTQEIKNALIEQFGAEAGVEFDKKLREEFKKN